MLVTDFVIRLLLKMRPGISVLKDLPNQKTQDSSRYQNALNCFKTVYLNPIVRDISYNSVVTSESLDLNFNN